MPGGEPRGYQVGVTVGPGTASAVSIGSGGAQPLALTGSGFSLWHLYPLLGTCTVTATVTDDDGIAGTPGVTLTVV